MAAKSVSKSPKSKASSATVDEVISSAGIDLCTLLNLFEVVHYQAQIIIAEGDTDTENYGLILEAVAEKGLREANAAMGRLHEAETRVTA